MHERNFASGGALPCRPRSPNAHSSASSTPRWHTSISPRPQASRNPIGTITRVPSVNALAFSQPSSTKARAANLTLDDPDLVASLEKKVSRKCLRQPGTQRLSPKNSITDDSKMLAVSRATGRRPSLGAAPPRSRNPTKERQNEAAYQLVPTEPCDEVILEEYEQAVEETSSCKNCGVNILHSLAFQTTMACLIIGNSLVIGMETDIRDFEYWEYIEDFFLVAFSCELLFKLVIFGCREFFSPSNLDFNWNVFDSIIVSLGIFDVSVSLFVGKSLGGGATLFRIVRLLRILRIIRIVKFLKQLYLLAFGLAEAAQAVFWVTILMTFILYVCGIIMVKTIGRPDDSDPNSEFLHYHFGGVIKSMFTLFVLMSSPNLPIYQDQAGLLEERPFFALFLVVFIVFGSFGMIALLTGVISESMFEKNDMRKEEERLAHIQLRQDMSERCSEMFASLAQNDEGEASAEDVQELIPSMRNTFESCGVFFTEYDLAMMVKYMDVDESGTISEEEFTRGMLVLAEGVRPISIQEVHHEVGVCRVKIERIETLVTEQATRKSLSDTTSPVVTSSSQPVSSETTSPAHELGKDSAMFKAFESCSEAFREFSKEIQQLAALQKEAIRRGENVEAVLAETLRECRKGGRDASRDDCKASRHHTIGAPTLYDPKFTDARYNWQSIPQIGFSERPVGTVTPSTTVSSASAWPGSSHANGWPLSSALEHRAEDLPSESLQSSLRWDTDQSHMDHFDTFGIDFAMRAESAVHDMPRRTTSMPTVLPTRLPRREMGGVPLSAPVASRQFVAPMFEAPAPVVESQEVATETERLAGEVANHMQDLSAWQRGVEMELQRVLEVTRSRESSSSPAARESNVVLSELLGRLRVMVGEVTPSNSPTQLSSTSPTSRHEFQAPLRTFSSPHQLSGTPSPASRQDPPQVSSTPSRHVSSTQQVSLSSSDAAAGLPKRSSPCVTMPIPQTTMPVASTSVSASTRNDIARGRGDIAEAGDLPEVIECEEYYVGLNHDLT